MRVQRVRVISEPLACLPTRPGSRSTRHADRVEPAAKSQARAGMRLVLAQTPG